MKVAGRHAAHGMKDEIQFSPAVRDGVEDSVEFVRRIHVTGQQDRRFETCS